MILAGTGHRSFQKDKKTDKWISKLEFPGHPGNSRQLYDRITALAAAWLRQHPEYKIVISGAAIGWDLALANAAVQEKRKLHMYIPFVGHGQTWKSFYKEEHNRLVKLATVVHAPNIPFSPDALLQRNKDMVDNCDHLLALWDRTPGGTMHAVQYAVSIEKDYTNLWNIWERGRSNISHK